MVEEKDPLVLSNYIFELLEVHLGVTGFFMQLHPEDVEVVVESVTTHAEKDAGTKTTLYVGQKEEVEVEEEGEGQEEEAVGVGRGKGKPHHPLMISVQKVRIRPGKGKGKTDGWFFPTPHPLAVLHQFFAPGGHRAWSHTELCEPRSVVWCFLPCCALQKLLWEDARERGCTSVPSRSWNPWTGQRTYKRVACRQAPSARALSGESFGLQVADHV